MIRNAVRFTVVLNTDLVSVSPEVNVALLSVSEAQEFERCFPETSLHNEWPVPVWCSVELSPPVIFLNACATHWPGLRTTSLKECSVKSQNICCVTHCLSQREYPKARS